MLVVLTILGQRPHRVADPDHAVGGSGGDPGQQPRPPGPQYLAPRPLGDLAHEVGGPVGDPPRITQRVLPAGADRAAAARELLESRHIAIEPPVHLAGMTMPHHRLGRHRPMVGKPAVELRPCDMQPLVGLIKRSGRTRSHVSPLPRAQTLPTATLLPDAPSGSLPNADPSRLARARGSRQ